MVFLLLLLCCIFRCLLFFIQGRCVPHDNFVLDSVIFMSAGSYELHLWNVVVDFNFYLLIYVFPVVFSEIVVSHEYTALSSGC